MTVKDRIGRRRYIAFQIETPSPAVFSRTDLIMAINRASRRSGIPQDNAPWLTVFDSNNGIAVVRVKHTMKETAITLLNGIREIAGTPVEIRTLKTSGTIKTLRELYSLPASRERRRR